MYSEHVYDLVCSNTLSYAWESLRKIYLTDEPLWLPNKIVRVSPSVWIVSLNTFLRLTFQIGVKYLMQRLVIPSTSRNTLDISAMAVTQVTVKRKIVRASLSVWIVSLNAFLWVTLQIGVKYLMQCLGIPGTFRLLSYVPVSQDMVKPSVRSSQPVMSDACTLQTMWIHFKLPTRRIYFLVYSIVYA